jgi:hypothetical protein
VAQNDERDRDGRTGTCQLPPMPDIVGHNGECNYASCREGLKVAQVQSLSELLSCQHLILTFCGTFQSATQPLIEKCKQSHVSVEKNL